MSDTVSFAIVVSLTAAVLLMAVLSNRVTQRALIPAPALVLVAAAAAVKAIPALHAPSQETVNRIVTVALLCILFDGGAHIGRARFRSAAVPIVVVGGVGTFLTVAAVAVLAHAAFGLGWFASVLVATAVAPTDPAVVFSVLGQREVSGRSGTILEGESGANDPVGIALMTSLVAAGGLSVAAFARVGAEFVLQMGVGAAVGVLGGKALLWFMCRVPLPNEGLYPLRTLASGLLLYGIATVLHGSGFLAVFVAGIAIGDARAPYKREIERFLSAVASLAEIVAFVVLGLTVDLSEIARRDVWLPGLVLGVVLAFVIRPVLVGACLVPARLQRNERTFVVFAGLKGAVPILLGGFLLAANVPDPARLYGIIVVVVVFSVVVQGSFVPLVARRLRIPMRTVEPEPWALGVRLRDEPDGVHRFTVATRSPADGSTIEDLDPFPDDAWISLVVRGGELVPVRARTQLRDGDEVLILADPERGPQLREVFQPDLG